MQKKKKKLTADGHVVDEGDDGSQGSDYRVSVIDTNTGKTLSGEDAPMLSQLRDWLEQHPGWEVADSDDESDQDEDQDGDCKSTHQLTEVFFKICFVLYGCSE